MKTRNIIAGMLTGALCLSLFTACSSETSVTNSQSPSSVANASDVQASENSQAASEPEESTEKSPIHTLVIRDDGKSSKITATFFNTMSDATTDIEMVKGDEGDDHITFTCDGDTSLYNMVRLTYGDGSVSKDVCFNSYTAGWYLKDKVLLPYAEGMDLSYDPKFETKVFEFDGNEKPVYIWTPDDYDKDSQEKYSTVYMFDGQTVLATGRDRGMDNDAECWNVSEAVEGMMSVTDEKAILVCITNLDNRDDELVPDLGNATETLKTKKRGNDFADFICDTIMPYIQENYNVYTDAEHTSLAGSSLGGLETFYTVLSHPDKFGAGGVLSASFQVYDDAAWDKFLSDKTDTDNAPFLYFYCGSYAADNGSVNVPVYNSLIEKGYPKDKLVYSKNESGRHLIEYWRSIYPEFLQAAFTHSVDALECGKPVEYKDSGDPTRNIPKVIPVDPDDPGLKDSNNFIYFDNSQVKWDKVYAYWWDAIPTNKISGGLYGAEWPGLQMEKIEGTEIYRMVMPMGPTKIVFSSGVTDAEVEKGVIAYQTADMDYDDQANAGQIFTIDATQEPKADSGKKYKTKFKYSAGAWSDYEP